jgi:hypothetical protein
VQASHARPRPAAEICAPLHGDGDHWLPHVADQRVSFTPSLLLSGYNLLPVLSRAE